MRRMIRWGAGCISVAMALLVVVPSAAANGRGNGLMIRAAKTSEAVPVNGSWVSFFFGRKGTTTHKFKLSSRTTVLLRVTDVFCRGDRFAVIEGSRLVGRTQRVRIDHGCNQRPLVSNPRVAFDSATYSHGAFLLSPGRHVFRIRALISPFRGGGAALSASHCSIVGTDRVERMTGAPGRDFMCAAGGADSLSSGLGPDNVYAGAGNDTAGGGPGPDQVEGESGNDVLTGGGGADRVVGGSGVDAVIGDLGTDAVIGGAGIDLLVGGKGSDVLDSVDGIAGNDLVVGGAGRDVCRVDSGDHVRGCERVTTFAAVKTVREARYARTIVRLRRSPGI